MAIFPSSSPLRRGWRALRRRLFRGPVDFVYCRDYQLPVPGVPYDALRGERVLSYLAAAGLLSRRCVLTPRPATMRALRRVHRDEYLESLREPEALTRVLGLRLEEAVQDRVLELQRWMAGGTLLAVHHARSTGRITVNLGGGFHHAFADHGARFCVVNDVAAAIEAERARGFTGRVLVVDLDLHDGDGTRSLFAEDPRVHTFSIHNQTNGPETAVEATVLELGDEVGDDLFLDTLHRRLPPVFEGFRPHLVIYLAGVDPAWDDEIGDWTLGEQTLLERDRLVTELAREGRRRPLAVVLGGGYGSEAWRYTARFCAWLVTGGEVPEPPSTGEMTLARYRHLARLFTPAELTGQGEGEDWSLTEEDLLGSLAGPVRRSRFLDYYSSHGIELALERSGVAERLRALGFEHPTIEMELDNPAGQTVRIFGDAGKRDLVAELRARRDRRSVEGMEVLRVEWLLLQNPRLDFTAERPRLPGQRHPGLGMLRDAVAFLILACERLDLDGVLFVPAHYHLAAQSRRLLRFLDPADEALFRAYWRALRGVPLAEATRLVAEQGVVNRATGEPVPWEPAPMVLAVSDRLKGKIRGAEYERRVAEAGGGLELEVHRED